MGGLAGGGTVDLGQLQGAAATRPHDRGQGVGPAADVAGWVADLERTGLAPRSVRNAHTVLSAMLTAAVRAGNGTMTLPGSDVPVIDARGENGQFVLRVPIPKSPHGVNISPDGRYAMCAGKLSPTVSVVEIAKAVGKIKPGSEDQVKQLVTAASLVTKPVEGEPEARDVPLVIQNGVVSVGVVPVGTIPPLRF